jgi:hypothetical protein
MRTARAVPTPWLYRKTMISRTIFCSAQARLEAENAEAVLGIVERDALNEARQNFPGR